MKTNDDISNIISVCGRQEGITETRKCIIASDVEIGSTYEGSRKEHLKYKNLHLQLAVNTALGE